MAIATGDKLVNLDELKLAYDTLLDALNNISGLPSVTSVDNGKVLQVVSGEWTAANLVNASGVDF